MGKLFKDLFKTSQKMIKPLILGLLSALYFDPVQAETSRSSASGDVGPFVGETWFSGTVPIDSNK